MVQVAQKKIFLKDSLDRKTRKAVNNRLIRRDKNITKIKPRSENGIKENPK